VGGSGAETAGVDCPGTQRALGGGTSTTDTSPGDGLLFTGPLENDNADGTDRVDADGDVPTGWGATWEDISGGTTITVFAICA
jgi:hypothetical protein